MTGHCDYFENYTRGYAYQGVLGGVGQGFSKTKTKPFTPLTSLCIFSILFTTQILRC